MATCKYSRVVTLVAIALLVATITLAVHLKSYYTKYEDVIQQYEKPDWQNGFVSSQEQLTFLHNAVAADATVCGILGAHVLNFLKGSAMDAAVSTALCIGVANVQSAGIGGGSMLMHYDRGTKSITTFNYRETAPGKASKNMFDGLPDDAATTGGLAIAVPGEVSGLALAHSRFGRLPWKTVVEPVVQLLRNGFKVTPAFVAAIKTPRVQGMSDYPPFAELKRWLINPATGKNYSTGDVLRDEKLAVTMQKIANDPNSFYSGLLANDIVQELQAAGSIITGADLRAFRPTVSAPVTVDLGTSSRRLHSMPPPSSGAIVGFVLNVLDGFAMDSKTKNDLGSYINFHHRLVEALKFGYAKRSALGDPNFVDATELLVNLTSNTYANEVRAKISDDATHDVAYYGPSFEWRPDGGTTHMSLVDSEGNAVTLTSTINTYFGSLVRGSKTGITYNGQMDDFSLPNRTNHFGLPESPFNYIEPGKRPASSAAPTFVTDLRNNLRLVTGAAGGSRIVSAVASVLARQLYLNESVKEATDAFRLHHQLVPNLIQHHPSLSPVPSEVLEGLKQKGHEIQADISKTVVEAIERFSSRRLQASGDFRKPSRPNGY